MNLSQSETTPSQNKDIKDKVIYFGPDNDTLKKIENIFIHLDDGSVIDAHAGMDRTNYDTIRILKNCSEIWFCFEKNHKMVDELYIPTHHIKTIKVNHNNEG
jgi:hypothetical protein